MNTPHIITYSAFILLSAVSMLILIIKTSGKHRTLQPLAALGFILMLAGILLGADPLPAYGLMSLGIAVTFINILKINKRRSRWPKQNREPDSVT